jgi:hypothetical protein
MIVCFFSWYGGKALVAKGRKRGNRTALWAVRFLILSYEVE